MKIVIKTSLLIFFIAGSVSLTNADSTTESFFEENKIALIAPEQSRYKNHFTFGECQKNHNLYLF